MDRVKGGQDMKWRKDVNRGVRKSFRDSSRNITNPEVVFALCVP